MRMSVGIGGSRLPTCCRRTVSWVVILFLAFAPPQPRPLCGFKLAASCAAVPSAADKDDKSPKALPTAFFLQMDPLFATSNPSCCRAM